MALTVLDASVVIAVLDDTDALHAPAVAALLARADDDLRLPASALAECLVGPAIAGRLEDAREQVQNLELTIEPLTADVAVRAAQIRAQTRSIHLPEALVLATGDVLDAACLLTGDSTWRRVSARVVIVR